MPVKCGESRNQKNDMKRNSNPITQEEISKLREFIINDAIKNWKIEELLLNFNSISNGSIEINRNVRTNKISLNFNDIYIRGCDYILSSDEFINMYQDIISIEEQVDISDLRSFINSL